MGAESYKIMEESEEYGVVVEVVRKLVINLERIESHSDTRGDRSSKEKKLAGVRQRQETARFLIAKKGVKYQEMRMPPDEMMRGQKWLEAIREM